MDCSGTCRKLFGTACGLALVAAIAACASTSAVPVASAPPPLSPPPDEQCPVSDALLQANGSDYGRELIKQVGRRTFYPEAASKLDQSGVVQLCIKVSRNGEIQTARVQNSSGYLLLDGAALYSVGRAKVNGVDEVPAELDAGAAYVWFAVPVEFRISGEQGLGAAPARAADEPEPSCLPGNKHSALNELMQNSPEGRQYLKRLQEAFQAQMLYPSDAKMQSEGGHAALCVVINRQGRILNARIARSAGDPLFDGVLLLAAGVVALRAETGPIPDAVSGTDNYFRFSVPVNWEISGR